MSIHFIWLLSCFSLSIPWKHFKWKCENISRILDSNFHKNGYKQIKISDQKALMDQRPSFDNGQNEQEITNDEKLGLVEISPLKESLV